MTMRLYFSPVSSNARRAVMTAHHLGLVGAASGPSVELALVDLGKGEQRAPSYLAMNPNGKVPTLDDEGFYLTESHAIMQYLADLVPTQTLYPDDLRARADVNRWMFWNAHHWAPAVSVLNWERVVKKFLGKGEPDEREIARGEMLVTQLAGVLDQHLATREWLSNGRLTLADLSVSTPLMALRPAKLPLDGHKHLHAWLERMQALDAWKKTTPMM